VGAPTPGRAPAQIAPGRPEGIEECIDAAEPHAPHKTAQARRAEHLCVCIHQRVSSWELCRPACPTTCPRSWETWRNVSTPLADHFIVFSVADRQAVRRRHVGPRGEPSNDGPGPSGQSATPPTRRNRSMVFSFYVRPAGTRYNSNLRAKISKKGSQCRWGTVSILHVALPGGVYIPIASSSAPASNPSHSFSGIPYQPQILSSVSPAPASPQCHLHPE
jgi:hypothetical protein